MKNLLIHGLGQGNNAWNTVKNELNMKGVSSSAPDLFELTKGKKLDYNSVYQAFSRLCDSYEDRLNLCGLSLGGLLALNYAIEHSEKVNSLVLIGTPFDIPKRLLKIQNFVFKLMPQSVFKNMGCSKKDFINLSNSMSDLNFMKAAAKLDCHALIICGSNDKANMDSAKQFHKAIKNSDLLVIEDSGHEVNKEKPNELANALRDFWN